MLGMKEDEKCSVFYWRSKRPHDITEFEFRGKLDNPHKMSGWINYMNLARSRDGELYLFCRGDMWTWILHRYDTESQTWTAVKGSAKRMMETAKKTNPTWFKGLGKTTPYYGPSDGFVTSWQPGAYNYCRTWPQLTGRTVRGISFDPTGRMHVALSHLGVSDGGEMKQAPAYAYSDDKGKTFFSAEGKKLQLPLTINPIPGHGADRTVRPAKDYYDVWESLIEELN
jgi:hypothetical protein